MKRTAVSIPLPLLKHLLAGEPADPTLSATLRLTPAELEHLEGHAEALTDLHTSRDEYNVAQAAHHLLARIRKPQKEGARVRNPRRNTIGSGLAERRNRRQN